MARAAGPHYRSSARPGAAGILWFMKKCPFCAEEIPDGTLRCPHCDSDLTVPSPDAAAAASLGSGWAASVPGPPPAQPAGPGAVVGQGALRFSHSGLRYLLGYGQDFFGIWDRNAAGGPVRRFPRTDDGWREAWLAYTRIEPKSVPVPPSGGSAEPWGSIGPGGPAGIQTSSSWTGGDVRQSSQAGSARRGVSGLWWLLPVLFGWLGGVIAWAVTRDREPRMARNMLITGIVVSVVLLLIFSASLRGSPR
jgi:hypothetical protein